MEVKDLSTKEKARRYDEAIERLRNSFYDNSGRMCEEYRKAVIRIIEPIFPELKESEDESIRKYLTSFVELNSGVNLPPEEAEKMLAWLKKQGEKGANGNEREVPNSDWSEEDEKTFSRICGIIHNAAYQNYDVDEDGEELGEYARIINWFKSLKERVGCEVNCTTKWKPADEEMKALDIAIRCGIQLGTWEEKALKKLRAQLNKLKES